MKKLKLTNAFVFLLLSVFITSCEVIAGIFKAGAGFGIFSLLAVAVVIVFFITRFRKGKNN